MKTNNDVAIGLNESFFAVAKRLQSKHLCYFFDAKAC